MSGAPRGAGGAGAAAAAAAATAAPGGKGAGVTTATIGGGDSGGGVIAPGVAAGIGAGKTGIDFGPPGATWLMAPADMANRMRATGEILSTCLFTHYHTTVNTLRLRK